MKVTTCIPLQKHTFEEKFSWLEKQLKTVHTDIFVTPQEYFGGDYIMPKETAFTKKFLLPKLESLSKETNTALVVGVIEKVAKEYNQEKIWFIDDTFKGEVTKFAEPAYCVLGKGTYRLKPENNLDNRFKTFRLKSVNVAGFFCWEVFGDMLMAGLGMLEPDLVCSLIKFGIAGYPRNEKNAVGLLKVGSIEWCGGDIWLQRLKYASEFELLAPIVCSTNSWGLKARFQPLVGTYYPFDMRDGPEVTDEDLKSDIVITDDIDFERVRGFRENKFSFADRTGQFPPWGMSRYTMMFKVHRIIQRMMGETHQDKVFKELKKTRFKRKQFTKKVKI